MNPVRALVTGASGFFGRHLTVRLRALGVEVATAGRTETEGLDHFPADLADSGRLTEILRILRPDRIFHLAGVSRAPAVADYYRVNCLYAAALFDAVAAAGLRESAVVALVGTAAECGAIPDGVDRVDEEFPCTPLTHYGASKLAQTRLGLLQARAGFRALIARPANLVGPGMPPHTNLAAFSAQLAAIPPGGEGEIVAGNLDAVRDYVDARDAASLLAALAENSSAEGQLVNLATGIGTSTRAALDDLVAASGARARVRVEPARSTAVDVPRHVGDPEKLRRLAGPLVFRPLRETLADIFAEARAAGHPA